MRYYSLGLPAEPGGIVLRYHGPNREGQTLWFAWCKDHGVSTIKSGNDDTPILPGPKVQLVYDTRAGAFSSESVAGNWRTPVYDSLTDCVYFINGNAVMRLDPHNVVTLVAGNMAQCGDMDGVGPEARFHCIEDMVSDGQGALYLTTIDMIEGGTLIRKLSLGTGATPAATVTTCHELTLPVYDSITALAYIASGHSALGAGLFAATGTGIYHLPLDNPGAATLVLGQQDFHESYLDGIGTAARFLSILGLVLSPDGRSLYIHDLQKLRKADLATWTVTTLAEAPAASNFSQLLILPQYSLLAVCNDNEKELHLFQSAEFASHSADPTQAVASPPQKRPLAELLQEPQDGPSSIRLRVRDKTYTVHRALLADRSAYFQQLLAGGFREASAGEVELPDADTAAVQSLLTFMYTGVLEAPPQEDPQHLRATLELAGRLLLDEASALLQERVLAAATPATLLGDLVWAERHNLPELAGRLKARVFQRLKEVVRATPQEAMEQLAVEAPALVAELLKKAVEPVLF